MYWITNKIAVHGLGEKGTHPLPWIERDEGIVEGVDIYDVRFMSDLGEDNPDALYALTIRNIIAIMDYRDVHYGDGRIAICCGAGQSRSCAIAVGVLIDAYNMDYYDAVELVKEKVPIANMDPSHLAALRRLYSVGRP